LSSLPIQSSNAAKQGGNDFLSIRVGYDLEENLRRATSVGCIKGERAKYIRKTEDIFSVRGEDEDAIDMINLSEKKLRKIYQIVSTV
jgi:hypothetical protein